MFVCMYVALSLRSHFCTLQIFALVLYFFGTHIKKHIENIKYSVYIKKNKVICNSEDSTSYQLDGCKDCKIRFEDGLKIVNIWNYSSQNTEITATNVKDHENSDENQRQHESEITYFANQGTNAVNTEIRWRHDEIAPIFTEKPTRNPILPF